MLSTLPSPPLSPPGDRLLPRWAWAVIIAVLAAVYLTGFVSYPPRGEEPRRALVAQEMIHSGDYLVPRLLGERYYGKPPLQNWLIAVLSGNSVRRAGAPQARTISLLGVLLVAWFLWRLGANGSRGPDPLPAVIFLSLSLVVSFGRTGEVDMLHAALVWWALALFESGRRRGAAWRMWFWPQVLLAAGALAKGLAPIFFYVPVLFVCWRRPRDFPLARPAAAAGAMAFALVVGAWLVPYSLTAPVDAAGGTWWTEIRSRFSLEVDVVAIHLATYPLLLLGTFLPWSIAALKLGRRQWRRSLGRVLEQPWPLLCGVFLSWAAIVYLFVPAVRSRYFLPAAPAFAVLAAHVARPASSAGARAGRSGLAGLLVIAVAAISYLILDPMPRHEPVAAAAAMAALVLIALAVAGRSSRAGGLFRGLLALGLVWGVILALVTDAREARRARPYETAAVILKAAVPAGQPVATDPIISHKLHHALTATLGRTLVVGLPGSGPYTWVGPAERTPPAGGTRRVDAWNYTVWEMPAGGKPVPLPWSGRDVTPPEQVAARGAVRVARARFERRPWEQRLRVDLGKRLLEEGDAVASVRLLTRGLDQTPSDPVLLLRRGQARLRSGDPAAALADLEAVATALKLSASTMGPETGPEAGPTRRMIARVQRIAGWFSAAEGDGWRLAVGREARREAALAHLALGRVPRAESVLAELAGEWGDDEAAFWLAVSVLLDGRIFEAREVAASHQANDPTGVFARLLRLALDPVPLPHDAGARRGDDGVEARSLVAFSVGLRSLGEGRTDEARAAFAQVIERHPPTSTGAVAAGWALSLVSPVLEPAAARAPVRDHQVGREPDSGAFSAGDSTDAGLRVAGDGAGL